MDDSWLTPELTGSPQPQEGLAALAAREVEMIEASLAERHGRISGPSGAAALGIPRLGIDKYGQKP